MQTTHVLDEVRGVPAWQLRGGSPDRVPGARCKALCIPGRDAGKCKGPEAGVTQVRIESGCG